MRFSYSLFASFNKAFTSSVVGSDGNAPRRVTATAPAAIAQCNASDITDNGTYTLVGNGSCFCYADVAPTAALSASPTIGPAPLTVNFDASGSSDPDGAPNVMIVCFTPSARSFVAARLAP